ncbi:PEGA domain-containing protein [Patescibacteria group bacterium]|nr:PEGA domain-containing protein [Patescibacteria group bacterium]
MNPNSSQKSLLIIFSVASAVLIGTFLISTFARGYRLDTNNGFRLKVTGLLSATSKPKSASVYIDNLLTTATDDTVNLIPGEYHLKIVKDGYLPWEKNIQIKPEYVYQADAQLFRSSPDLNSITEDNIVNPVTSPDSTKIVYAVASSSAVDKKPGLYLLELTEFPILMSRSTQKLLSPNLPNLDWSKYSFEFSPNSRQILATSTSKKNPNIYLFSIDQSIDSKNLFDVSSKLDQIKNDWQANRDEIVQKRIEKLPLEIRNAIATTSAILSYNSSENKVLYQASSSAQIKENLLATPPPTKSTQTQQRLLNKDSYYVYDIKEDTNFLIGDTSISQISWLPYSNNLVFIQDKDIRVSEYDATNYQTIYSGYISPKIILPTPDGYRLILSTSTNQNPSQNLYSITIRDR